MKKKAVLTFEQQNNNEINSVVLHFIVRKKSHLFICAENSHLVSRGILLFILLFACLINERVYY